MRNVVEWIFAGVSVLSLCLGLAATCLAFPQSGGNAPGHSMHQMPPERQSSPSPEELEQRRQAREEARKIVAARVNDVPITMDQVVDMMNVMVRQGHGKMTPEAMEEVRKQALDMLIMQELAYQKAKSEGLVPDAKKVDDTIANIKGQVGGEDGFKKFLENQGLTEEELRARIGRNMVLEQIFTREIKSKTTIPEGEIEKEYEREKHRYITPEKIEVVDVVFFLKPDNEDAVKKAEGILTMINEEHDKDPWKLVPDGTFIVRHYEIKKDKERELYEAAKKLKEGEVSGVIKTPDSLHIIKMEKYTPEKQFTFEEAKPTIEASYRMEAQKKRLKEWEQELRKDAKIEIVEPQAATDAEQKNKGVSEPQGSSANEQLEKSTR